MKGPDNTARSHDPARGEKPGKTTPGWQGVETWGPRTGRAGPAGSGKWPGRPGPHERRGAGAARAWGQGEAKGAAGGADLGGGGARPAGGRRLRRGTRPGPAVPRSTPRPAGPGSRARSASCFCPAEKLLG